MAVAKPAIRREPEAPFSMRSSHVVLDQVDITFDDPRAVAHAGLLLPATLAKRLGMEQATDQLADLGDRTGGAQAAHAGACPDRWWRLHRRRGAAALRVDRQRARPSGDAASTVGTLLRAFTFGHVRQLDKVTSEILSRARSAGAGPGDGPLTVDVDSTICEVHGYHSQGACYG
jgi:hypothetical protein